MIIEPATPADAPGIARVHVQSWRETYEGIVPDEHLNGLSEEKRQRAWTQIISDLSKKRVTLVARNEDEIVGFVNGGEPQQPELGYDAELAAIYLLKSHQKLGIGKELFSRFISFLGKPENMYLWVLQESPTVGFYSHMGGMLTASEPVVIGGRGLIKDLYSWDFPSPSAPRVGL
jgi:GNAT superfamily N-acetyltransferase